VDHFFAVRRLSSTSVLVLLLAVGCSSGKPLVSGTDADGPDTTMVVTSDAGAPDAGSADRGAAEGGLSDAGAESATDASDAADATDGGCDPSVTYATFGMPFFATYCWRCHTWDQGSAQESGDVISSAAGTGTFMPPVDPLPTVAERARLVSWIACGAP
jgi:hypothetical protein